MPNVPSAVVPQHTEPPGEYPGSTRPEIVAPAGSYAVDSDDITRKLPTSTDFFFTLVSTRRLITADASLILPTPETGRF